MEFFLVRNKQTNESCIAEGFEETRKLDTRLWEINPVDPTRLGLIQPLMILKIKTKKGGTKLKPIFTNKDLEGLYL